MEHQRVDIYSVSRKDVHRFFTTAQPGYLPTHIPPDCNIREWTVCLGKNHLDIDTSHNAKAEYLIDQVPLCSYCKEHLEMSIEEKIEYLEDLLYETRRDLRSLEDRED
jgi:hypothetical protein